MLVRVGHSPDPDDAFMFYGLTSGLVANPEFQIEHVIEDIESLNRRALKGDLEVTAISAHAYAHVSEAYYVMRVGASFGLGYGPIVVGKKELRASDLKKTVVAIPGKMTSAYALLTLALGDCSTIEVPFHEIMRTVSTGKADAGVIIHEGQLTYNQTELKEILDLGEWWRKETKGLPVPLGLNASKRILGASFAEKFDDLLRDSIRSGTKRWDDAINASMRFARGASLDVTAKFVRMYVNELSLDMGADGERSLREFYSRTAEAGLTGQVNLEVV